MFMATNTTISSSPAVPDKAAGTGNERSFPALLKLSWRNVACLSSHCPVIDFILHKNSVRGTCGFLRTNKFACFYFRFYEIYIYIPVIVDKISLLYFVFVSSVLLWWRREELVCWPCCFSTWRTVKGFLCYKHRLLITVCCFLIL